jgi:hypothetical protein
LIAMRVIIRDLFGVEFEHVCNKVLKYLVGLKISIS